MNWRLCLLGSHRRVIEESFTQPLPPFIRFKVSSCHKPWVEKHTDTLSKFLVKSEMPAPGHSINTVTNRIKDSFINHHCVCVYICISVSEPFHLNRGEDKDIVI